jgi:hypothetical protein
MNVGQTLPRESHYRASLICAERCKCSGNITPCSGCASGSVPERAIYSGEGPNEF